MDGDFLIDQIKDAMSVETTVFYTGNVEKDVVRNPLVSKIVSKYDEFERIQGVGNEYKKKIKDD